MVCAMPVPQRLSTTTDGREVVVKQAAAGTEARRLQHEATVLRRAQHPGVVEVVADRLLDDGGHELMVALVGARTLGDLVSDDAPDPAGIAGVVVAVATTVADLHDLGVAHTRLSAEHVLLDAANRPVLCGFGDAVVATDGAPLPVSVRAVDVAALGSLLRQLLTATDPGDGGWEPIPTRRLAGLAGVAGRGDRWQAYARRTLLNVADRATVDDAAHRPDARTFAADVLAALPEARLPGVVGATDEALLPSRVPRSSRPRWSGAAPLASVGALAARVPWTPIVGAVGLGLLLFGLNGVLAGPRDLVADDGPEALAVDEPDPSEPAPSTTSTAPTTTAPPATSTTGATCDADPAAGPVADPDGDGCPSPVSVADGAVDVGGVRYAVGEPGDLLGVGDWDCDGAATVALVERASGRVFLFDRWAGPGEDVSVASSAVVAEPTGIEVVGDQACDVLVVTGADGTRTEVTG
jgi:tRNA A-37 threonylcarbamoyl transferase component Bud32